MYYVFIYAMNSKTKNEVDQGIFESCMVWCGPDLEPTPCTSFSWGEGVIREIEKIDSKTFQARYGIIPGLINGHTHVGDCFLPEVAVPLTLEEAFFRPNGYKYVALKEISEKDHVRHMTDFLNAMASSGTIAHVDFREQGLEGAKRLREASTLSGVKSIILSQFNESPQKDSELKDASLHLEQTVLDDLSDTLEVADGFSESTMNDLTDAAWTQIREQLRLKKKASAIHCLESHGYRDLSMERTGKGDLQRALELLDPDLIVHLTVATVDEIQGLADSGKTAVLNPRANAALGLPLPPVAALMKAGVNLLLGTDNGILNGPDLFKELDFTYKLARSQWGDGRHPLPTEIFKMVTSNFSKTPWGKNYPGILEEGLPANFVVVDFQKPAFQNSRELTGTLLTRTSPEDILQTVRQGKTLYSP